MNRLTIDIAVGGRFHADRMASALVHQGHHVRVFSTLPRSRFRREGDLVESLVLGELFYRAGKRIGFESLGDHLKMKLFGRAVARRMKRAEPDVLVAWSSFAREAFRAAYAKRHILVRDSSHIEFQLGILEAEYRRLNIPFPNRRFVITREIEEYELADRIIVLSDFARKTFLDRGVPASKLHRVRLGADPTVFKKRSIYHRGLPIRVVYFGAISVRKGIPYLLEATKNFPASQLELHLVGPVEPGLRPVLARFDHFRYHAAMPQRRLADLLETMDVFAFPTLEDGFGQTLVQAMAVGIVPVATSHCGAAEAISPGKNGHLVPVQDVDALREVFEATVADPNALRAMQSSLVVPDSFTWKQYANDLASILHASERLVA